MCVVVFCLERSFVIAVFDCGLLLCVVFLLFGVCCWLLAVDGHCLLLVVACCLLLVVDVYCLLFVVWRGCRVLLVWVLFLEIGCGLFVVCGCC